MKCADIMSTKLEWLSEQDSVQKAALLMADAGVGFLPICDARMRVIGVVTDRDLTTRVLAKKDFTTTTTSAALVMSSPALTCLDTADVRDAEALMGNDRKCRLPITNADGQLVGVLSLADLVEHAPGRQSLETVRRVLWREALGPRGGASRETPLLKNDPIARNLPAPSDDLEVHHSVVAGGHHSSGTKEFPG